MGESFEDRAVRKSQIGMYNLHGGLGWIIGLGEKYKSWAEQFLEREDGR